MRVLAIGATGFIGPHVVRLLTEQGHDVSILHRGETSSELPQEVRHIFGDRDDLVGLKSKLERFRPDVVLDLIPYTEAQAKKVIETFRGLARRVVSVSSADVYRNYDGLRGKSTVPPDRAPLSEDAPLRETRFPYQGNGLPFAWADDYDKILVETVVLGDPDLPGTVLRLPAVYGPGDKQHRLRPYLRPMDDGRSAILLSIEQAEWRWTRGYVKNVAAAIALVVADDRTADRIYNVGEEPTPTEREWIDRIGEVAGWTGKVVALPAKHLPEHFHQPFDFRYDLASNTRCIRDELGYVEPVPRQKALEQTIEWERSQRDESGRPDYAAEDAALANSRDAV